MAQTIKLKRSALEGVIPTTSQLELGEVAINTYDGKVYIKKDVGGTETIVQVGGDSGTLDGVWKQYSYTATSGQTTFSGADSNSATLSYIPEFIEVFLNGVLLDPAVDFTAVTGSSVVLTSAAALNDLVQINAFTKVLGNGDIVVDAFTGDGTTSAYTLSTAPSVKENINVFIDGVYQENNSYSVSGTTLTLSENLPNASTMDVVIGSNNITLGEIQDLNISGNITVSGTVDGRDIASDGSKLDGIESDATADQTAEEIKTLVGNATDSNVFTDADHTKLDGIEALADVTDTTNVEAAGALMDSELTDITAIKALNQGVATTDSPSFAGLTLSGVPTAPTAAPGTNTTQIATTAFTTTAIANLIDTAPATLNTLNELAAALGDDPNFATTVSNSIGTKWTQDNTKISNWDTAYSWGDHAAVGYLTSFTETDPTVPAHVKSITTTEKTNWDTAYSWGDHADEGYLTSLSLDGLTDVSVSGATNGQSLVYNSTSGEWEASTPASTLGSLTDVSIAGVTDGQSLVYNSTSGDWEASTPASALDSLTDVTITSATTGDLLQYDGTDWVNVVGDLNTTSTVEGSDATSDWTQATGTDPWIATLTVSGILSTDRPIVDIDLSSVALADVTVAQTGWSLVYRIEASADDEVKLYATDEPAPSFDLLITVVR